VEINPSLSDEVSAGQEIHCGQPIASRCGWNVPSICGTEECAERSAREMLRHGACSQAGVVVVDIEIDGGRGRSHDDALAALRRGRVGVLALADRSPNGRHLK
jgi:hypothetical protein